MTTATSKVSALITGPHASTYLIVLADVRFSAYATPSTSLTLHLTRAELGDLILQLTGQFAALMQKEEAADA